MLCMTSKKPRPEIRPRPQMSFRLSERHLSVMEAMSEQQRRTKTTIIEMAIEKLAAENGLWPPPEEKR